MIVHSVSHPEQLINEQKSALMASSMMQRCFAISYTYHQYYLPGQPALKLFALVALLREGDDCAIFVSVTPASERLYEELLGLPEHVGNLSSWVADHQLPWINLSSPLLLDPVYIPKPWGQEVWYTGIEARGQSSIIAGQYSLPLPWLLSLMPEFLVAGNEQQLVLLKILDPLPDDVYGDLYFEMHEQKQEVYVVTDINPEAWPDKVGGIRLGFAPEKRAQFADDQQFKKAYLSAVKEYENIRREIDRQLDIKRVDYDIGLNDPVDPQRLKLWQQELSAELLRQEQHKREAMYSFTAVQPLRIGDVVKVPCCTPHALQHGVRTVEFQTPVYERKIISFAQKVLTQSHWDTEEALEKTVLDQSPISLLKLIFSDENLLIEQVVVFDDFEVHRIRVSAAGCYEIAPADHYHLLMVIAGTIECYAKVSHHVPVVQYVSGQALLLPASLNNARWVAGADGAILLLAMPSVSD